VTLGQEVVLVDGSALPEDTLLSMPGEHNRLNAALAYEALKAVSLTDEEIFSSLVTFPGVPGRLQFLAEHNEIKIINDNNATTPQATMAGLKAVGNPEAKNVILIAGGAYKDIDPQPLLELIPDYCKQVILLPGTGTDMIKDQLEAEVVETMEGAVQAALAHGQSGDILLFSPGFASFGLFQNEYQRNDAFLAALSAQEEPNEA